MQMVSAVKMRKAQNAALASRTYTDLAWQIITNLSNKVDPKYNALLSQKNSSKKIGVILISTNSGLVGAFNTNLINKSFQDLKINAEIILEAVTLGKKGRDAFLRLHTPILADFPKRDRQQKFEEILPVTELITEQYLKGNYSKIFITYTKFISTVNQKPVVRQLLPLILDNHADLPETDKKFHYDYLFEPSPKEVLDHLVPRIIESQVYQAILESDASEHSARMIMMKNATEAATDLIADLTLTFNQLRQGNITQELAEITAGRIALE